MSHSGLVSNHCKLAAYNGNVDAVTETQNELLNGLNEEQRSAVTHGTGPLLIVAGAGTGKTTVITKRIAWLLEQGLAKPEEILALTFTEKAAAEMAGRVGELLPLGHLPEHIYTFHGFGDRLLKEFSLDVGLPPTYKMLRDLEQVLLLREHLYELPLDFFRPRTSPGKHLKLLTNFFSRIKLDDLPAEEYAALVKLEETRVEAMEESPERADAAYDLRKQQEIAACFEKYEELKADAYAIDQSDQVFRAYRLLRDHEVIQRRVRDRFKYILVDEYQDVDVVQARLVNLLAGTNGNVTVVGDDDQSIYGFRGASVSNILEFPKVHDQTATVVLTTNYRSTQNVLDAAYRLIQHNGEYRLEKLQEIDKRLRAERGAGAEPVVLRTATAYDEAEAVAERIVEALKDPELRASDIAILTRKNATGEYFRSALLRRGIPVAFEGAGALYDQTEIKICLAFLELVVNPRQHTRLRLLLTSELYGMPHTDVAKLEQACRASSRHLWDELEAPEAELSEAGQRAAAKLREEIMQFCRMADTHNAAQVLYQWLTEHTDWVRREELSETDVLRTQNLSKLFRRIRTFVENASDTSVAAWTEYFHDILAYGEDRAASERDFEADAVQIMTAHGSKGLEFPIVFVAGLAKKIFPMQGPPDQMPKSLLPTANLPENDALREERRLCYVALTRARDRLILSSSESYESSEVYEPSQFIGEAMGETEVVKAGAGAADPLRHIQAARPELALASSWQPPDPLELSYSAIEAYDTCPLKFYWEHVERVYVEPNPATEYGNLLHEVIAALNHARMRGEQPTHDQIDVWFDEAWASRQWRFMSSEHRDKTREKGREALRQWWTEELTRSVPFAIEEDFRVTVGGVLIKGRFDRIEKDADGYRLVDYKSSVVPTQMIANRRANTNQQLTLYAMAVKEKYGEYPTKLSLYFVDTGKVGSVAVSPRKLKNLEAKIEHVAQGIRDRNFEPKKARHFCTPTVFNFCPGNEAEIARER